MKSLFFLLFSALQLCGAHSAFAFGAVFATNDNIEHAAVLPGVAGAVQGTIKGATALGGEPPLIAAAKRQTVWYQWTAPATGSVSFSTRGGPMLLQTYSGPVYWALQERGGPVDLPEAIALWRGRAIAVSAEEVIYVRIDGVGEDEDFTLDYAFTTAGTVGLASPRFQISEHDTLPVTLSVVRTPGTTGAFSVDYILEAETATPGADLNPTRGTIVFGPDDSTVTFSLSVTNDDAAEGNESLLVRLVNPTNGISLAPTSVARVQIEDDDDDPANDLFSHAQELSGPDGEVSGTLVGAGVEPNELLVSPEDNTVWYSWSAEQSGYVEFSPKDGQEDLVLGGFLQRADGSLFSILYNGANYIYNNEIDRLVLPVQAGRRYFVRVANVSGKAGHPFVLKWHFGAEGVFTFFNKGVHQVISEKSGTVTITILRDLMTAGRAVLHYSVDPGSTTAGRISVVPSAEAGTQPGELVFEPSVWVKTLTFRVQDDGIRQGWQSFAVRLESVEGGVIGEAPILSVDIQDDDSPSAVNDRKEAATVLGQHFALVSGDLAQAHGPSYHADLWYRWTAPATGEVLLEADFGERKTCAVYISKQIGNDSSNAGGLEWANFQKSSHIKSSFIAEEGITYYFEVFDREPDGGTLFTLQLDMDADHDGLMGSVEAAFGLNPADPDSDDDGIKDSEERDWYIDTDGDGLVNALDPDSDNDGLFDGTEIGLTIPQFGTDITAGKFIPDFDAGLTKTDPLVADTDGGGALDGYEDGNHNGAVDAGESDPHNPNDEPLGTVSFVANMYQVREGESAELQVRRVGNLRGPASVGYTVHFLTTGTAGSNAVAGADDLDLATGTVEFSDGQSTKSFQISTREDGEYEDPELFAVALTAPDKVVIGGQAETYVQIRSEDSYQPVAAHFSGLLGVDSLLSLPVGSFGLDLSANGRFTGTLKYQSQRISFKGSFRTDGFAEVTIQRPHREALHLQLRMVPGAKSLIGTLKEGSSSTEIFVSGTPAGFDGKVSSPLPAGLKSQRFTFLLRPGPDGPAMLGGTGYATGVLSSAGLLRFVAVLPDRTKISMSTSLDGGYQALIGAVASKPPRGIYGRLSFVPDQSSGDGNLNWIREPARGSWPEGFSCALNVVGSAYTKPLRGHRILEQLDPIDGRFSLTLLWSPAASMAPSSGNLSPENGVSVMESLSIPAQLGTQNQWTEQVPRTHALHATIDPASGLFHGTVHPLGEASISFWGVTCQKGGFFEGLFYQRGITGRLTSVSSEQE